MNILLTLLGLSALLIQHSNALSVEGALIDVCLDLLDDQVARLAIPPELSLLSRSIAAMNPASEQQRLTEFIATGKADVNLYDAGLLQRGDPQAAELNAKCEDYVTKFLTILQGSECPETLGDLIDPLSANYRLHVSRHVKVDEHVANVWTCMVLKESEWFVGIGPAPAY